MSRIVTAAEENGGPRGAGGSLYPILTPYKFSVNVSRGIYHTEVLGCVVTPRPLPVLLRSEDTDECPAERVHGQDAGSQKGYATGPGQEQLAGQVLETFTDVGSDVCESFQ
jgi:hypothetical protein